MTIANKVRLLGCMGLTLIVGLSAVNTADAGLFGLFGSRKKQPPVVKTSLVVFPFDQATPTSGSEDLGEEVGSYLRSMLTQSGEYMALLFQERLSPIKRAKEDTSLKTADVSAPFSGENEKCLRLAKTLAVDAYLVGSIEDYQYDATQKVAQITLSAEMYDGKTGKLLGQYLVTGTADESSKATDEAEFRAVAAGKAVDSLKDRIIPPKEEPKPEPKAAEEPAVEAPAEEAPAAEAPAAPAVEAPEKP